MLEGKIVNQPVGRILNSGYPESVLCGRCSTLMPAPTQLCFSLIPGGTYYMCSAYESADTSLVYETKLGPAICYCSSACRDVHNHRYKHLQKKVWEKRSIRRMAALIGKSIESEVSTPSFMRRIACPPIKPFVKDTSVIKRGEDGRYYSHTQVAEYNVDDPFEDA